MATSTTKGNSRTDTSSRGGSENWSEGGSSSSTIGGSSSHTVGGSTSSSYGGSHSESDSYSQGHSSGVTSGSSQSTSNSIGGSTGSTTGKSWASGTVSDKTQANYDKATGEYQQSAAVQQAYANLQSAITGKPAFQSQYEDKLSEMYNQIMNRDKFSYNFNEDPMYQMYRDQYTRQGRNAMEDTMGAASKLSGGYASSYAQSAGQQSYQNYLQELNNMIPQLRNQAYQEYQDEGNRMLNNFNMTNSMYNQEYQQYRDAVGDWNQDRSFNQGVYSDERNFDYNKYQGDRGFWQSQYWNERNSEQSNMSNNNSTNWNAGQTNTNSLSRTESDNWSQSHTSTDATNWSNTNTQSWSDTDTSSWSNTDSTNWNHSQGTNWNNSTSNTSSSSSTVGSDRDSDRTVAYNQSASLSDYTRTQRNSDINYISQNLNNPKALSEAFSDLLYNGTVTQDGTKITYTLKDLADIYNRAAEKKSGSNGRTNYEASAREQDIWNMIKNH